MDLIRLAIDMADGSTVEKFALSTQNVNRVCDEYLQMPGAVSIRRSTFRRCIDTDTIDKVVLAQNVDALLRKLNQAE